MSNKVNEKGLKVYTSRPWESIKTSFLVITWIILGLHLEIIGPTLGILAGQTGQTIAGISTILMARNGGYMIANIIGASVQKVVNRYPEALLSISFLLTSIVVLATPSIYNIIILSIIFFFQGISQGITDLGGTSLMLRMWGDNVAAPLNVVHLGYGFGAVFANLLVKPYLGEDKKESRSIDNSTLIIEREISNIQIPYSITAFCCLLVCVGHFIFALREQKLRRESLKNRPIDYSSVSTTVTTTTTTTTKKEKDENMSQYSPKSCGNGYFNYGLTMSIIFIFYMFFLSGNDQTFGKFFFVYLKSPEFSISTRGATWGMVIYWLSYSVGRLICAIVTVYIPVHIAISGLWICGFLLGITWIIFVWIIELTSTNLFILGAFTGLVFSPTFPLSFGFLNQRLTVNPLLVALLLCGSAFGGIVFPKLGGIILDNNRKHFPTLLISCVLCSIILFISGLIISTIHQNKLNLKKPQGNNISHEEEQLENDLNNNL